ncbi:MAG TPA: hypothetical protein VLA05_02170 [Coriobacteriia bacterium]|nr:hypothetical protein [Coriobacteriia bacterium]
MLIVVGAIALAGQVIPGLAWWSLWPLIIVIAGLVQAFTPGRDGWSVDRLFDGFVTVAFGLVVLSITTGYAGFGVVWQIITLWPVLLIAIGLDLLGKGLHMTWIRALGSVLVIAALAYAVAVNASGVDSVAFTDMGGAANGEITEPVAGVQEAELTVDAGVANVTLSDGQDLVKAEAVSPWGTPDFSVVRSGTSADVKLSLGGADNVQVWPGGPDARLNAELSDSVLWDMHVNTGVSSLRADLREVPVRSLELKPGVADCNVTLGDVPTGVDESQVLVKSGISSVTLSIPSDVEARVESDSGLTGHNIDSSLSSLGSGVWETSGFDDAKSAGVGVWLITVKSGIGSVNVTTY